MKRCARCVMPETWTGITFDEKSVCNICGANETKKVKVNWGERQKALNDILRNYKKLAKTTGNKYDCMVPFSGGKDSAYTLWAVVEKYGLTPLVVTFDHSFPLSPEAEWNLMEIPKQLDCDHLRFTLGNGLRNALCKKASEVMGDFCWHCHNGVGALPARISKQWDIPLQVWGEPTMAEYQTAGPYRYEDLEEQDKEHFEKVFQAGITPEMVLPRDYNMVDLLPMTWPDGEFTLKALYLGCYEPWDQRKQVEIITRELGWKHHEVEGTYVDWDKIDCPFEPVRDWQKFMKRGFGRTTFQASKDIREGLMSREEGMRLVEELDGKRPGSLDLFLKEIGMTEKEFESITKVHVVPVSEQ
ncbi:MAG: N-acetyl sugar amidotransferase [Deltaproteobacteria bacterium]|nr:N-acetyl sugar amidotransferase [Deltaproteobacteria bacterium]